MAGRLGISIHSLYAWRKQHSKPTAARQSEGDQQVELRRVKSELRRVIEGSDTLKKAAAYFAKLSG